MEVVALVVEVAGGVEDDGATEVVGLVAVVEVVCVEPEHALRKSRVTSKIMVARKIPLFI